MRASKVLIIEDDWLTAENVAVLLKDKGYKAVTANCVEDAWKSFGANQPDLVLMDIDLNDDTDGIELAARMNQHHSTPIIYFTDKNDERVVNKARNVHHASYMTKPFTGAILLSQVELVLKQKETKEPVQGLDAIFVKDRANESRKVKISYNQIYYIKACRSYCELYISSGDKDLQKVEPSKSMGGVLQNLPSPPFIQVHRSYAINIHKIDFIEKKDIVTHGVSIPIGENFKEHLSELLNQV